MGMRFPRRDRRSRSWSKDRLGNNNDTNSSSSSSSRRGTLLGNAFGLHPENRSSSSRRRRKSSEKSNHRQYCIPLICAFFGGILLMVPLWARLQALGVRGPWLGAVRGQLYQAKEESLEWLVARQKLLDDQLTTVDARISSLGLPNGNPSPLPERENAASNKYIYDPGFESGRERGKGQQPGLGMTFGNRGSHGGGEGVWKSGTGDGGQGEGARESAAGLTINAKEGHAILGLSTEDFGATSVDQMMGWYDSHSCDLTFGNGLVDTWRQRGRDCCGRGEGSETAAGPTPSSIRCHLIRQESHAGNGDNLVHMRNVQVDLSYFDDPNVARKVMEAYKRSAHNDQAYVSLDRGAVKGMCTPVQDGSWQEKFFPGWNADWTTTAFKTVNGLQCDEWVEHPVMVMQRDTFANLFHDSEDFVNAFLAMAVLQKRPKDVQIFLTDLYPKGPFWPMWEKVFGVGQPALTSRDIGKRYGNKNVCFRDLTIGIFGPAAPTTLAGAPSPCFHTALVTAYSDFVIRGLGLQGRTRYASPPSKKVVVTWMARRSSVQWPERNYCSEDGKDSFFTCDYFRHLGTRELQRKVRNEKDVVASLKALERTEFANGAVVEVRDMDYNLLSFEDQIINDLETDIMIGPHGAGLFHIIFTPDRAQLIELKIDDTAGRKHFHNLAGWSGHKYTSRGDPNPVPAGAATETVSRAISEMDLSRY